MDKRNARGTTGGKVAVTVTVVVVALVCGWSAGGWGQGLVCAATLGTAGGIAAFSDRPGGRFSCTAWRLRHHRRDPEGPSLQPK